MKKSFSVLLIIGLALTIVSIGIFSITANADASSASSFICDGGIIHMITELYPLNI